MAKGFLVKKNDCSEKNGSIEMHSLSDKPLSGGNGPGFAWEEDGCVFQWMWYAGYERQAENPLYLPASWEHSQHCTPQSLRTVSPAQTSTCTIRKPQWIILTAALSIPFNLNRHWMYLGVGVCIVVASNNTSPLFCNKYLGISQSASKHFMVVGRGLACNMNCCGF